MSRREGNADRERRIPIRYAATLTTSDGREHAVQVTDVSANGFRLEGHLGLRPGDHVYLRVEKQRNVPAEIRWVDGPAAGGSFFEKSEL